MISIVGCSVNEKNFQQFSDSVQKTIGVEFEIVRIDNSHDQYGICQAYNKGAALCRYDHICFVHEDVIFVSENWGQALLAALKDPHTGLVGIIGLCYYGMFPLDWQHPRDIEGGLIQRFKYEQKPELHVNRSRFPGGPQAEVVAIDGVFMATRKEIIQKIRFSEEYIPGFHGYDLDLAMKIRRRYKIVVARDILLIHLSEGFRDQHWHEIMKTLYKKWKRYLPAYVPAYSKKDIKALKLYSLEVFRQGEMPGISSARKNFIAFNYAFRHGVLLAWLRKNLKDALKKIKRSVYDRKHLPDHIQS